MTPVCRTGLRRLMLNAALAYAKALEAHQSGKAGRGGVERVLDAEDEVELTARAWLRAEDAERAARK